MRPNIFPKLLSLDCVDYPLMGMDPVRKYLFICLFILHSTIVLPFTPLPLPTYSPEYLLSAALKG